MNGNKKDVNDYFKYLKLYYRDLAIKKKKELEEKKKKKEEIEAIRKKHEEEFLFAKKEQEVNIENEKQGQKKIVNEVKIKINEQKIDNKKDVD